MSQSAHIVTALVGLAASVAFASGTHHLRTLRHPHAATYARFHTDPAPRLAECEGTCEGSTGHEGDGDGIATCTGCGTPRVTSPGTHLNGAS
ncbi:hypothetical protein IHE56_15270 [Streptomyces sp. ID01-12c]|uniref:hypothetical protein n=1 Tax=Streptomyces caniscabiei TaxID=2746961 RepID=UPI001784314C|nr:hypothetical protein [Streptomyces caniscabiei]MBD9703418.1 hypothetical protein [Streptomyces caniscabiei]MDX3726909.1 hypothetical protein [Streptomyces caniscabiei]